MKLLTLRFVKNQILHDLGGILRLTRRSDEIPKFSTFFNVRFYEYRITDEDVVSVGFCQLGEKIDIILLNVSIERIEMDVANYGPKKDLENKVEGEPKTEFLNAPFVFTLWAKHNEKHPFTLHPDQGYFLKVELLRGHFQKAFNIIVDVINNTDSFLKTTSKKLAESAN